jgi:ATP/maltotriose-dependent transcriptional regulator MalT
VDIALATDDLVTARRYADDLARIAAERDVLLLTAMSDQAAGCVLIATGQAARALPPLRRAWSAWQELDAPYFAARVRATLGRACRELGDMDAARTEFNAARAAFERLGAQPDLQQVRQWSGGATSSAAYPAGLTAREVEVLRMVAAGKSNRAIAGELLLSEKTVARHISNLFGKLGVSSRAAATAYAYEHELV